MQMTNTELCNVLDKTPKNLQARPWVVPKTVLDPGKQRRRYVCCMPGNSKSRAIVAGSEPRCSRYHPAKGEGGPTGGQGGIVQISRSDGRVGLLLLWYWAIRNMTNCQIWSKIHNKGGPRDDARLAAQNLPSLGDTVLRAVFFQVLLSINYLIRSRTRSLDLESAKRATPQTRDSPVVSSFCPDTCQSPPPPAAGRDP